MKHYDLSIQAMGCGSCVRKAAAALSAVPGVAVGRVSVGSAAVTCEAPEAAEAAVRALAAAGYPATAKEVQHDPR